MAAVSQLLVPLEEAGLIQRSEDPKDHRAKQISSTEKAKLRVHERISDRHSWLDDLAALLTNQEKEEILPGLLFLINRLANYKEALALTKTRSLKPPRQPMSSKGTTILSLNKKQKSRAE
jgi:DNA-binding MarR family transcriptional regulator